MCTMQQSASAAAEAAGHHDNASVNPRVLSESLHHYTVSAGASADLSLPEPSAAVCASEQVVHVDQQTRSVFHRLPALRGTSP